MAQHAHPVRSLTSVIKSKLMRLLRRGSAS